MDVRSELFARRQGLVRTSELLAIGDDHETIRILRNYRKVIRVRQGWWALPGTPDDLMLAWRAGGRLACTSALAFHGQILDLGHPLHVEFAHASKGPRVAGVVPHWSRRTANGDRRAVSIEVAKRQATQCRAAAMSASS